jgi:acyl-CoA thioesterase I
MTTAHTLTDGERRHFLRYTNTGQWPMLQRFPVSDDLHAELLAQMLASTPETIRALIGSLRDEARAAAAEMLADPRYRRAVTGLPFRPQDRIAAVGDSITADRLGWFELLAASLDLTGRPVGELVNLSISGNTTADVLERFDLLEAARPTRVLLMLGTNDARAHGRTGSYRMATADETGRNLRALVDLVTRDLGAEVTVITPPAVDQARVDVFFSGAPLRWYAADVAGVARIVREIAPAAIDLGDRPDDDLLETDGVHPTPAGQRFILTRVVEHLSALA